MAIKIPSKNIFGASYNKFNQRVGKSTATVADIRYSSGNILQNALSIQFRDVSLSEDKTRLLFKSTSINNAQNIKILSATDYQVTVLATFSILPYFLKRAGYGVGHCNTHWGIATKPQISMPYDNLEYKDYNAEDGTEYSEFTYTISKYDVATGTVEVRIVFNSEHYGFIDNSTKYQEMYLLSAQITDITSYDRYESVETFLESGEGDTVFKNETNELLRKTYSSILNTQLINYKNGKETLELLCSFDKYYDYDTNILSISHEYSTNAPMAFQKYKEVIPMSRTAQGTDTPMSTYADGTPKVFIVLGTEIIYDGAVWQKLFLQEK